MVLGLGQVGCKCGFVWARHLVFGQVLGLDGAAISFFLIYNCYLHFGFLFSILSYQFSVGLGGLSLGLCTQWAWSALVRGRFVSMIK